MFLWHHMKCKHVSVRHIMCLFFILLKDYKIHLNETFYKTMSHNYTVKQSIDC